ncbi:PREDICTED: B-cell receptor-associated protein 31-like [Amphimedon queenslandica]|uniref:Endoplasmic reticulum transmembrane protein n=1 Tax=Amphimedon queenslandica TaxID=400682 RepID=A0A1X7VSC0_AMPQE|nr:PREDICTED: B-cell receptor-associated protein 31-like [Amphimedon queenslandica]|eukprot:XP_019855950.1 PREDICTED: B-cell receptor-associated protein 31-like [Amphimedon queenslandica]
MTLQWQVVAFSLYAEIFLTIILILPLLKPSTWKYIFSIRIFSGLKALWKTIFFASLLILVVLFVDSIRTMNKYNDASIDKPGMTLDTKLDIRLKQCRGQRNFYITGFSLFLMFIIYRLVVLLFERASLEANHQAALAQAQSVSRELQRRLDQSGKKETETESEQPTEEEKEKYLTRITELEKEVKKVLADRDAMRKQAESLHAEYDRLSGEYQKIQKEQDGEEDKKEQ